MCWGLVLKMSLKYLRCLESKKRIFEREKNLYLREKKTYIWYVSLLAYIVKQILLFFRSQKHRFVLHTVIALYPFTWDVSIDYVTSRSCPELFFAILWGFFLEGRVLYISIMHQRGSCKRRGLILEEIRWLKNMKFNNANRFFGKLWTSFEVGNKASWLKRKELKPNISRCYREITPLVKPGRKNIV